MTDEKKPPQYQSAEEAPPFLTVDEAAQLLRLNRKTVYDAVKRKELPGARTVGRAIRIERDRLLQWFRGEGRGALPQR